MTLRIRFTVLLAAVLCLAGVSAMISAEKTSYDPTADALKVLAKMKVGKSDSPMWGGWPGRNNTPEGKGIATEWDVKKGTNIKWASNLGSQTYGNPVVANGKVFIATNNGAEYVKRYPSRTDLGVLLAFDEKSGNFLWQLSREKLPTGRVHDWPFLGICATPYVDGDKLWCVTNRNEVVCLDVNGFHDGKNDGPFKEEANENKDEADVIWSFDLMAKLSVSQHNACSCSITGIGDTIFVCTSNGVDEAHFKTQYPEAPSFLAMDRNTGKVLWSDNSPASNIMHGQWSSPAYGVLGGQEQAIFCGGDGWVYSFDPKGDGKGKSKLLWKFDCNPKKSVYALERATRNHIIATPVIYDGLVYVGVGEDPEHGEGSGHLWCIDPTKRGDVSPEQVFNSKDPKKPIAYKRLQACDEKAGDFTRENPNSGAVWHYTGSDPEQKKFEDTMHRTLGSVAIKNDLLYIADQSGLFHCLNAKTGKVHWTHDMLAASWASPLIVDEKVYMGDEDGDICIFKLSADKDLIGEINMGSSVYSTPVVANNVLFIASKDELFAIQPGAKFKRTKSKSSGGEVTD
jgi:outer membrane protein assembly factor BamB